MLFPAIDFMDDPVPRGAAVNMAIDETLLRSLSGPLVRVYKWKTNAVSFGCFEKFEAIHAAFPDRELVRRWTGGGIVPHGEDLTYSLLVPAGDPFLLVKPSDSYCKIHNLVAEVLRAEGAFASVAEAAHPKVSRACFENAVQHDLVSEDCRKIAGAAQRRAREGLLHQGSIQNVNLSDAFGQRLAHALAMKVRPRALTEKELGAAEELAAAKYAFDGWMRRW